ncbi:hypothetical protein [Lacinutrix salivirga]
MNTKITGNHLLELGFKQGKMVKTNKNIPTRFKKSCRIKENYTTLKQYVAYHNICSVIKMSFRA